MIRGNGSKFVRLEPERKTMPWITICNAQENWFLHQTNLTAGQFIQSNGQPCYAEYPVDSIYNVYCSILSTQAPLDHFQNGGDRGTVRRIAYYDSTVVMFEPATALIFG